MVVGGDAPAPSPSEAHVSDVEILSFDEQASPVTACHRTLQNYTVRADLLVGAALGPCKKETP